METISNEQLDETAHTSEEDMVSGATDTENSLGKFKDAQSLLKSYDSLQSEFTKRCQRIKELEGEKAALEEQLLQRETLKGATGETIFTTMDKLTEKYPVASQYCKVIESRLNGDGDVDLRDLLIEALVDDVKNEKDKNSNEESIYASAKNCPKVTDKLIEDYLSRVVHSKAKAVLLSDASGASVVAPPKKPKDFYEAGNMAREILRKKN